MWMFRRRRQRGPDYGNEDDATALYRPLEFESGDGAEFRNSSKPSPKSRVLILAVIFSCVGCLGIGIVIGWFAHPDAQESSSDSQSSHDYDTTSEIITNLSHENIRRHLRVLTSKPRLTGTPGEDEAVDYIADQMRSAGLDSVEIKSYDGLLSFPNSSSPNTVQLVRSGAVIFTSQPFEKGLFPGEDNSKIVPPFNSYAPAGKVQGQLVYVNYGRLEDFVFLRDEKGVNFINRIVIARYGKIFRGDKLELAAEFGALGLILYNDPADFNADNAEKPYPDSWWMPPSGLQRGTVGKDGDYLTPFYPATDSAYRRDVSDSDLPKIPCQPIGYGDAYQILRHISGDPAPSEWQGGLNFTYNIGPDMDDPNLEVVLEVNNYLERRPVKNVIGTIRGREEPDRYVLLGNHHDSWAYGAIDPLSGSAAALDISRVFGNMIKQGWRPRRTIVICSWSGEEQGLIGSTEWVEDYLNVLYDRAVAYLNVDYTGDYSYVLYVGTSPLLQDAIFAATKKVPNPDYSSEYKTLYDVWRKRLPSDKTDPNSEPDVYYSLGSGSDMATFYQRAGVPSVDMYYTYDEKRWPILSYPLYHSAYETFHMYTQFIDPTFNYTVAMGQLWAILACDIADAKILPFDTRRYSTAIDKFIRQKELLFKGSWEKNNIDIESLKQASKTFQEATAKFQSYVINIKSPSELQARQINDKLMGLERAFIDPEGLPGRRIYKHIVFAPSKYDAYSDNSFPGMVDAMADIARNKTDQWEVLKQQVSVATHVVAMAANSLDDIGL